MSTYSTADYLLDRANIHDTVTKLYLLTDFKEWDLLASEVPASTGITLDYSKLFGSPPAQHSPQELVSQWKTLISKMTTTQHIVTGLLIDLPQPGQANTPTKATVIANVYVNLFREGMEGGSHTSNGGRADIKLVREEGREGNPWRVENFAAMEGFWSTGNMNVLTG